MLLVQLTTGVHGGQHDGGDPRYVAVADVEVLLDVLEENGERLGERVGEADGDERPEDHHPAPSAVRGGVGRLRVR